MKRVGAMLLDKGSINAMQLDEALQCQVAFGGRLGTNLVELGYVTLDRMAEVLSEQLDVPLPTREWLEQPDPEALRALPVALVKRLAILPLALEPRLIHVAMIDPRNPQHIADISFAASREVKPYLVPELRLHYWLERHYRIQRETRYIFAGDELARGRYGEAEASQSRAQPRAVAVIEPEFQAILQPLDSGQELTDESTFASVYGDVSERSLGSAPAAPKVVRGEPASPRAPSPIAALESTMQRAVQRDGVIAAALQLAGVYTRYAALFIVHQGLVQGIRATRGDGGIGPLEGIFFPVGTECLITAPARTGEMLRAKPSGNVHDVRLFSALGRSDPADVAVFPVKIRGRAVNVLYVDNGPEAIAATAFAALSVLPGLLGEAYERLIIEQKRA